MKRYWNRLHLAVLGALFAVIPSSLSAEGMAEIMADFGDAPFGSLYTGPDGNADPGITSGGDISISSIVDVANIPEGRKMNHLILRPGSWWGIFFNNPVDMRQYAGGQVRFWLRSPDGSVDVYIRDGAFTRFGPSDTMQEYAMLVPSVGLDLAQVVNGWKVVNGAASGRTMDFDVDHIRWMKKPDRIKIFPSSVRVNTGKRRQFTVEAYDVTGSTIVISAMFSSASGLGSLSTSETQQTYTSIFEAGATPGVALIQARDYFPPNINTSASIEVTEDNLDQEFSLLSDLGSLSAILGGTYQDARLDYFYKDLNKIYEPLLEEVTSDVMEGRKALKTTVNLVDPSTSDNDDPFSGWTIRWGNEPPENLNNLHYSTMSNYYDGSIRFWFKGPPGLADKLRVGIRSANVPGGLEVSKDLLSDLGVPFDNQWQPVVIPLERWAKSRPFADLSRIKNFFTVSVVGDTAGSQSFYIDNLRWDTRKPEGSVVRLEIRPKEFREGEKVFVPLDTRRTFRAVAFDINGTTVDCKAQWTYSGDLGNFTQTGNRLYLEATNIPSDGVISATCDRLTTSIQVEVAEINPTATFNVYTDAGIPVPTIGISTGPNLGIPNASEMTLGEIKYSDISQTPPVVSDGVRFMRSTMTLVSTPVVPPATPNRDAWSVWLVGDEADGRFLKNFDQGFLRFWVRSTTDLEVSVSPVIAATDPIENRAKIRLEDELGVPMNGQWQEVVIALDELKLREPRLGDLSNIRTFFAIGSTSEILADDAKDIFFDVDNVQWLSVNSRVITDERIYQGLVEKRLSLNGDTGLGKGLVRSFGLAPDTALNAVYTYDQALAAMTFIYWSGHASYATDIQYAKDIFNFFKAKSELGVFSGFPNAYDATAPYDALSSDTHPHRFSNPNAFMLLALVHYKNVTKDPTYDVLMGKLATWLVSQQASDGGLLFAADDIPSGTKFTAYSMAAYAAFNAYQKIKPATDTTDYKAAADKIAQWLSSEMYDSGARRFFDAERPDGSSRENSALNTHSFATLIFGAQYEDVVRTAETYFLTVNKTVSNTGQSMSGFDYGSLICNETEKPVDKDVVWLEGTAQMVLAYKSTGSVSVGNAYLDEIMKAVFEVSPTAQAIPLASNQGTPYGFFCPANVGDPVPPSHLMDESNASVSAMTWYLFARHGFNPFHAIEYFSAQIRSITTHLPVPEITWTRDISLTLRNWDLGQSYVEVGAHVLTRRNYFVSIYTDNTNLSHSTRFVDPTPPGEPPALGDPGYAEKMNIYKFNASNPDSNPSGLLLVNAEPFQYSGPSLPDFTVSSVTIPLAWTLRDRRQTAFFLRTADPNNAVLDPNDKQAPLWFYMKDIKTPLIDPDPTITGDEIKPFDIADDYVRVYEGNLSVSSDQSGQYHLSHVVQGDSKGSTPSIRGFYPSYGFDYLYFEAQLANVVTPAVYKSPIYLDFMSE